MDEATPSLAEHWSGREEAPDAVVVPATAAQQVQIEIDKDNHQQVPYQSSSQG